MLDRLAPLVHLLRMFALPAGDPALLARGATMLEAAGLAGIGPGAAQDQSLFLGRVAVDQTLAGRAKVDVLISDIAEVWLSEPALGRGSGGERLGKGDGDSGLLAGQDLLAAEVATVGNRIQLICL